MNKVVNTALSAIGMMEIGGYASKIRGRRNYSVRLETKKKVAFVGGYGLMKRRNLLSECLEKIEKYGITWIAFTYKQDLDAFLEQLEKQNFKIVWIDD